MPTLPDKPKKGQDPAMANAAARLDAAVLKRLDVLATYLAPIGSKPSRSVALRACIFTGLEVLEAKHVKGRKP